VTLTDRNEMGPADAAWPGDAQGRFVVHPGRSFLLTRSVQRSALGRRHETGAADPQCQTIRICD
jgi:hypothetical protein